MRNPDLMTGQQAADWLGVSQSVVTRLANSGKLPHVQVGARRVFAKTDLQKYLEEANLTRNPEDKRRTGPPPSGLTGLSFFSGAGGLDIGLERAGIPSLLYCESNKECRMTLNANRPSAGLVGDIQNLTAERVREYAGLTETDEIDVMFGGPPCQAFSTAGARRAFDDVRGNVFLTFLDLAKQLQPKYLVIENVRGLLSTPFPTEPGGKAVRGGAMRKITDAISAMKYSFSFNLYNAANFGAPQIRERVILIAKRDGSDVPYLQPTHSDDPSWSLPRWRTFNDATSQLIGQPQTHTEFPERRLKYFRMLKEGEYWRNLPEDVQEEAMGKAYRLGGGRTGFYRRIDGNRPAPTLVTSPTMPATDLCHPHELRPLSVEEYKAIQGFPNEWWIAGSPQEIYRQIGNAVPVNLGEAIGHTIQADMNQLGSSDRWANFPFSRYRKTSDKNWSMAHS